MAGVEAALAACCQGIERVERALAAVDATLAWSLSAQADIEVLTDAFSQCLPSAQRWAVAVEEHAAVFAALAARPQHKRINGVLDSETAKDLLPIGVRCKVLNYRMP